MAFNSTVSGIYLSYQNQSQSDGTYKCVLSSTQINSFPSASWLFNTQQASNLCGHYVGVANSDTTQQAFLMLRLATEGTSQLALMGLRLGAAVLLALTGLLV